MKKIAITLGDPNGISPEITIKALNFLDLPQNKIVITGSSKVLDYYKDKFGLYPEKKYEIIEIPFSTNSIKPGKETEEAGEFAFRTLVEACKLVENKNIDAIVTAPVSKNAFKLAGHNYSGQTEILENYLAKSNQNAEMLFVSEKFSTVILTRHIALKEVPSKIKKDIIVSKIENINTCLQLQLGILQPKFAICALNPHAGENGMFGEEEIKEIIPAVKELQQEGINIQGPFPADSLFVDCMSEECSYNCYIAMYHDQGLIPVKLLNRNECVNTTIGLDILRTSPAHGTAFDIAGKNIANPESMINAIKLAIS